MNTPRISRLLAVLAALLAAAACAPSPAPAAVDETPAAVVSDFTVHDLPAVWRDASGRERTLASLGGRARVVAMVYTTCGHTCPAIVAEMKRLEASLSPDERPRVGFVLVSLDPARDDPARLAAFAEAMRLDPAAWTLLTGDDGAVRELAALLGLRYRREADGQISHSNTYLVLDGAGRIVHRQEGLGADAAPALARIRAAR
jgi:protein SCO1/2